MLQDFVSRPSDCQQGTANCTLNERLSAKSFSKHDHGPARLPQTASRQVTARSRILSSSAFSLFSGITNTNQQNLLSLKMKNAEADKESSVEDQTTLVAGLGTLALDVHLRRTESS